LLIYLFLQGGPDPGLYSLDSPEAQKLRDATESQLGRVPYDYQMQVALAALNLRDSILIVRTGGGKSLPMVMPLTIVTGKFMLILVPLLSLADGHVSLNPNIRTLSY
jgi:hypothetical protein